MLGVVPPHYGSGVINAVWNRVYGAGVELKRPDVQTLLRLSEPRSGPRFPEANGWDTLAGFGNCFQEIL